MPISAKELEQKGKELSGAEIDRVVDVILRWIEEHLED